MYLGGGNRCPAACVGFVNIRSGTSSVHPKHHAWDARIAFSFASLNLLHQFEVYFYSFLPCSLLNAEAFGQLSRKQPLSFRSGSAAVWKPVQAANLVVDGHVCL